MDIIKKTSLFRDSDTETETKKTDPPSWQGQLVNAKALLGKKSTTVAEAEVIVTEKAKSLQEKILMDAASAQLKLAKKNKLLQ